MGDHVLGQGDAGAAHQGVGLPQVPAGGVDKIRRLFRVGHVGLHCQGPHPPLGQLLLQVRGLGLGIQIAEGHAPALVGEGAGHGGADTPAAAGDEYSAHGKATSFRDAPEQDLATRECGMARSSCKFMSILAQMDGPNKQ